MEKINIDDLKKLFLNAWSKETCFPTLGESWTSENPTLGQCAVTALIINDLFGGTIFKNNFNHYWNVIETGEVIDLTEEQSTDTVKENEVEVSRDYILFSERAREFKTLERYQLLLKSIHRQILHIDYVPETLEECFEYLNKFLQDRNVFKGVEEDEVVATSHHSLGRWLRNKWYLWWDKSFAIKAIERKDEMYPQLKPEIITYFQGLGVNHPDDMSGIIILSYHRNLNDREIELEKQIQEILEFYKNSKS